MSTSPTEHALLRDLVRTPSVSGDEEAVAVLVESRAREAGLGVVRDDAGVRVELGPAEGRTLALVSHLDVVPPGEGWTCDPFGAEVRDGRLYGRGSGDAKASVAAMLAAAMRLAGEQRDLGGRLLLVFGHGEETRHTSMPEAVVRAGRIDAAIIGEPTNLEFAVAQRGLMMIDLVARGDQRHAGRAADDGVYANALVVLSRDLVRLRELAQDRPHAVLGQPTITPTMVEAGVSRNVTPPVARAILDVRSTPAWTHAELTEVLRRELESEVIVTSDRLVPCETPPDSALLSAARRARPAARTYGSPTCSDWVFLRHCDAVKCGPGTSRRSHTPDECVELAEVSEAVDFYTLLAREYLS